MDIQKVLGISLRMMLRMLLRLLLILQLRIMFSMTLRQNVIEAILILK